tara:strand:- start:447 stop:1070 length:624 start_codon:yes stop_codon:yes gene_type:complete
MEWNDFYEDDPLFTVDQLPDRHIEEFLYYYNWIDPVSRKAHLQQNYNIKILDSGCGAGKNAQLLNVYFKNLYAIDISENAITKAKHSLPNVHFSVQDARNLDFTNESFDVIIDAGCLHVIEPKDHQTVIDEYYRILQPNGLIFLRLFNLQDNPNKFEPIFHVDRHTKSLPVYGFNEAILKELIKDKFHIERLIFSGTYHVYLHKINN